MTQLRWHLDGHEDWLVVSRLHSGAYRLTFSGFLEYDVSVDGRSIQAIGEPEVSPETLDNLYYNQVLPLALSRQGKLVLHAACVEIGAASVAFVGKSGQGKSTLAASFARNGFRFLTDDGLQIEEEGERFVIQPSRASVRLWHDSRDAILHVNHATASPVEYTTKSRFLADHSLAFCDEPRSLRSVYMLGDGTAAVPTIAPLRPSEAMVELVRYSFLLDIEEREALSRHFAQLSRLVASVKIFRLDYPRDYACLPDVRKAVVDHVASL